MTVFKINENRIKIRLTDTEVISCFGNYEKLYCATVRTKLAINALLRDIIPQYKNFITGTKIIAKITARKHLGCEITVYTHTDTNSVKEYILSFKNSESLTQTILQLYRNERLRNIKSSLYCLMGRFVLIIESNHAFAQIYGFEEKPLNSHIYAEYVREYGKAIIIDNAVSRYGKAFLK